VQFAVLFNATLASKKLILITVTEMYRIANVYVYCEKRAVLCFPNTEIPFVYTCASWFQPVLQSGLFLSCVELRIIF